MQKRIVFFENGMVNKIAELFGFSRQTVNSALSFKTQSSEARMLRAAAVNNGGQIVNFSGRYKYSFNDVETRYETAEGLRIQTWGDVELVLSIKEDAGGWIRKGGKVVLEFTDVRISDVPSLQEKAIELANN